MGLGAAEHQKSPLLQIGCQTAPVRRLAAQAGKIGLGVHFLALPQADGGNLLHTQTLGLVGAAPEAEKEHARHRHSQQQAHPGQLIGGAARAQVNPHRHQCADKDQDAVDIAGLFPQQHRQKRRGDDLGQHGQGTHEDAGDR